MRRALYGGNKDWLKTQLQQIVTEHIDSKKEPATPPEFRQALSLAATTIEMQYYLMLALLSMKSLRERHRIDDKLMDFASLHMGYYTRGTTGQVETGPALLFRLRSHYLHL